MKVIVFIYNLDPKEQRERDKARRQMLAISNLLDVGLVGLDYSELDTKQKGIVDKLLEDYKKY